MVSKLHQKRKAAQKEKLMRKRATRLERKRVLIICEGAKTEPLYFKRLVSYYGLSTVDIRIFGEECGSDPLSVVQYGANYLKQDNDFDFVFFVFDRDSHRNYDVALQKVDKLNRQHKGVSIQAITSNPCFEVWFLTHYGQSNRPYERCGNKSPAHCVIDDLRKEVEFKNYSKGKCDYFEAIQSKIEVAIRNSQEMIKRGKETEESIYDINPSTFVYLLVSTLQEISSS